MTMKILLVSSFFPPTHTAGTEKRTLGYALHLHGLGHKVQVVCAGKWDEGDRYWNGISDEIYMGIPVRRIHLNWTSAPDPNGYLYRNPIIARQMVTWLKEWKPDVVHVTSCYTLTASVIQVVKNMGLPIVLTLTDYWFMCPKHTLLRSDNTLCDGQTSNFDCLNCLFSGNKTYRNLTKILPEATASTTLEWISKHPNLSKRRGLRGMVLNMGDRKTFLTKMIEVPDFIIAPSAYLSEVYKEGGISRSLRVIPSGHDLAWLEKSPEKKPADWLRFGYIGQIVPIKGLHILLSAFAMNTHAGSAHVSIYGDYRKESGYTQQLINLTKDLENSIKFQGDFPHERLGEVLSEIDVLVVPSQWHENNPRVIQEAFASKTPVIASNVGGIIEFVKHEVNGLLFERGDVEDLYDQLFRVINEPGLIDKLRAGIQPVKTVETEVEELISIYNELTSRSMNVREILFKEQEN